MAQDRRLALVDAAPFQALRYDPAVAGSPAACSAPAYDLIEPLSYTQHRTANPYTVLELMAPDGAYRRSGELFARWRRSGVLVPEGPAFFRYEEHELVGSRDGPILNVQRGILAAVRLESLDGGAILPHEEVDAQRVAARLRRLEAVPAELDPVYLMLEDPPEELTRLLSAEPASPPVVAATDERGTDHRIWALPDPAQQRAVRSLLAGTRAVIADGHHRYARSLAFRDRRRASGLYPATAPEPSWERVLAYLVDPRAGGPRVEAIHRLVQPLASEQRVRLLEDFTAEEVGPDPHTLLARLDAEPGVAYGLLEPAGAGLLLRARDTDELRARLPADRSRDYKELDATVLEIAVLPRLGLPPDAVKPRFDIDGATAAVRRSTDAALILLRPPAIERVVAVAARGERLPPKSTRFVPKPRTGLLLRPLDEVIEAWGAAMP